MIFGRRVKFALIVLSSHLLLIALAIAWGIQMIVIARNGSVKFVEYNQAILVTEITLAVLIAVFGIVAFVFQLKRLGEKRRGDDRRGERRQVPD
jgi:predicted DNA repair protein MutK